MTDMRIHNGRRGTTIGMIAGLVCGAAVVGVASSGPSAVAQSGAPASGGVDAPESPAAPARTSTSGQAPQRPDFGKMLVDGLRSTEGCVGVELAQMQESEMLTIIAWFENKEAVKRWYYHPTHRFMMRAVGENTDDNEPLEFVKDEDAPVMVMASIKMAGEGEEPLPGPMPISAIAIEMYTPLPGGAAAGGRLMPTEIDVPHFSWMGSEDGEDSDGGRDAPGALEEKDDADGDG